MKAVIMAGGQGTRLRPLTSDQPKPMIPIANLPCMEHIVGLLKRHDAPLSRPAADFWDMLRQQLTHHA